MSDNRDPELLGLRLLSTAGTGPLSERADRVDLEVPAYGTPEADGERMSFNGKLPKPVRRPPAEPTHALEAPPRLVDDEDLRETYGLPTLPAHDAVGYSRAEIPAEAWASPLCTECLLPRTRVGRWLFCENEACSRYEEPVV